MLTDNIRPAFNIYTEGISIIKAGYTSFTITFPYSFSAAFIEKLTRIKSIIERPKTIDEAVNRLLTILTDDEKEQVKALPEDDLVLLHFSLGRDIRNAFGLNSAKRATALEKSRID